MQVEKTLQPNHKHRPHAMIKSLAKMGHVDITTSS